jgi:hypothetical protein
MIAPTVGSLIKHIARCSAEHYVDKFENNFIEYVGGIASVIYFSGPAAAKPAVQVLVNAYHELGLNIFLRSQLTSSHVNTLHMFVLITGASLEHSGENESLKILEQSGAR